MNKEDLIDKLNSLSTAERRYRDDTAEFVLRNPEIFPFLIETVFSKQGRLSVKAAWVIELVCLKNLPLIYPYLDLFSKNLKDISDESALRPLMKVSGLITGSFYRKKDPKIMSYFSLKVKDQLTEVCFDCLIGDHKIGSKVFAMDSLLDLGKEFKWILPDLKQILLLQIPKGSKGYLSHAKMILKEINKSQLTL